MFSKITFMYSILRFLLFLVPAEKAHEVTLKLLKWALKVPGISSMVTARKEKVQLPVKKSGIDFPNPVGLAAGFDKDGKYIDEMAAVGFGFVEVGTVTPRPQPGNSRPRLFRLKSDRAIINRMGFNNEGVDKLAERLKNRKSTVPVGGNIGKNKDTPNEGAINDYLYCLEALQPWVDYFVINLSSPNTPGLRELQDKSHLKGFLEALREKNESYEDVKPMFLKIAPDLNEDQRNDVVELVNQTPLDGIIATNTTTGLRNKLANQKLAGEQGGLSGAPLSELATETLISVRKTLRKDAIIISSGGIMSEKEARRRFEAGAELVQLYSGFVYEGPGLIERIVRKIK